jgi:hypothetical protein
MASAQMLKNRYARRRNLLALRVLYHTGISGSNFKFDGADAPASRRLTHQNWTLRVMLTEQKNVNPGSRIGDDLSSSCCKYLALKNEHDSGVHKD